LAAGYHRQNRVDPQISQFPAASLLKLVEQKAISEIDDQTLILADVGRKALNQVQATVVEILIGNGMDKEKAKELATPWRAPGGHTTTQLASKRPQSTRAASVGCCSGRSARPDGPLLPSPSR
jgi:hypothetical protein